jgi:WD40 repeat protein
LTEDGHTLAAECEGRIQLWDLSIDPPRPGRKIDFDPKLANDQLGLAFAPHGKMLAVGFTGGWIRLIDVAGRDLQERRELVGRFVIPFAMAFSPDAKTLAIARFCTSDGRGRFISGGPGQTVRVFELATGKERWSFTRSKTSVSSLSFARDGKSLAFGWEDGKVTLVEDATGKQRAEFQAGTAAVNAIAHSPNSKLLATASNDGQVAIWAGSGKRWSVKLPGPVYAVAWAPDSRHLATANANGTVYILRVP